MTANAPRPLGQGVCIIAALVWREWRVFRRIWLAPTVGSAVEPIIYLLVFGYGFGAIVTSVVGIPYLDFMATGAAANAVLLTGLIGAVFNGFFRRTAEHLYEGLLAAPIRVTELVSGEAAWTAVRAAGVAISTVAVAGVFGVNLAWTVIFVPAVGLVGGFAFACLGAAIGARLRSDMQLGVVAAVVFAPMFVVSWTFFPLDGAPAWLQWPSQLSPLTHVVSLLRAAAFGRATSDEVLAHAGVLLGFTVLFWMLAVRWLRRAVVS
jgi:lipooligosaccharide transport system permease protein